MYTDEFVLCGELEEDLNVIVGRFVEVCKKRDLKINVDKSKVMVLGEKEGLVCEFLVVFWMNQVQMVPNDLGR